MKNKELYIVCPECNGDGFTGEHNPDSVDEHGEHYCDFCPVQVECFCCKGEGFIPYIPQDSKEEIYRITKLFHDAYEQVAKEKDWDTQESCKVEFDELPEANRETMLKTVEIVLCKL